MLPPSALNRGPASQQLPAWDTAPLQGRGLEPSKVVPGQEAAACPREACCPLPFVGSVMTQERTRDTGDPVDTGEEGSLCAAAPLLTPLGDLSPRMPPTHLMDRCSPLCLLLAGVLSGVGEAPDWCCWRTLLPRDIRSV